MLRLLGSFGAEIAVPGRRHANPEHGVHGDRDDEGQLHGTDRTGETRQRRWAESTYPIVRQDYFYRNRKETRGIYSVIQVCQGFTPGFNFACPMLPRYPSVMDTSKMLPDLRKEREQIEEAIIVLERLAVGSSKRRGRPPAWMAAANGKTKRRGRRAARIKIDSFRVRRRWRRHGVQSRAPLSIVLRDVTRRRRDTELECTFKCSGLATIFRTNPGAS